MNSKVVGFLGLGAMGFPMARNLVERGYKVVGWDPRPEACAELTAIGGEAAGMDAALGQDVLMLSLPHSDVLVKFANETLLPRCRKGQTIVDYTTLVPREARSLAAKFQAKGAHYLDCPVSGGPYGVERRLLRIFVGGNKAAFDAAQPLMVATTASEYVYYCGESGKGQIVKGVNQLAMGLLQAAGIEAVWYGLASGVDADLLDRAVGGEGGFRAMVSGICEHAKAGRLPHLSVKFDQYDFFLDEAHSVGFPLPIVERLKELMDDRPKPVKDANQYGPSYWNFLTGDDLNTQE